MIKINYKKFENNKKKENNEPFDLEKYIIDIELYHKQREILDLLEILETVQSIRAELSIPIMRLRELGITIKAKPRSSNKMKVEWID